MVGPTKVNPRFLSSLPSAIEAGVFAIVRRTGQVRRLGRSEGGGSNDQKKAASEPSSPASARARRALLTVDSILPRWRTIPASFSRRATSRAPKRATASTSNPRKAARKLSRFRRMVSQLRPDWKPSRQSFSKRRRSSATGKPHSSSW